MGGVRVDTEQLLTARDAQTLLGQIVERMEPTAEDRRSSFVCFGARGAGPAIVCEMVSLASAPFGARRAAPILFLEIKADRSDVLPRRTVSARWEQNGSKLLLTYTCVCTADDDDDVADRATGKRGPIAALARVVSERLSALAL